MNKKIALLSALIFAVHPIHTGRVANITAGFDLLGIFFMLFSFYLYVKFSKLQSKKYFLFSLLFFVLALFASEEAITLPIIIVLYEFVFKREKFNKKNISDFPFIKYINLQKKKIKINKKINSINSKLVTKYITKLVNSIFSDLFRHLLKKKMSLELLKDFKKLGVKI